MAASDTRFLSIREAGALLRDRSLTSVALTRSCLDLIAALDRNLHSFIRVTEDVALEQAEAADKELASGSDRGPLHGIPFALKDLYATEGIATTAHSKVLVDWIPEADSAVTKAFKEAGAVLLGKLAMHEFAAGKPLPICPSLPLVIPGTSSMYPEAQALAPVLAWPPGSVSARWVQIREARFAARLPSAGSWASSQPSAELAAAASFH